MLLWLSVQAAGQTDEERTDLYSWPPDQPPDLSGPMVALDGDTLLHRESGQRIRLFGIDAPEIGEPGGLAARGALDDILVMSGGALLCWRHGEDGHGRTVAVCRGPAQDWGVAAAGRWDVAVELLRYGDAITHRLYLAGDPLERAYRLAECRARRAAIGLWENQPEARWTAEEAGMVPERPKRMPRHEWMGVERAGDQPAACGRYFLPEELRLLDLGSEDPLPARHAPAD